MSKNKELARLQTALNEVEQWPQDQHARERAEEQIKVVGKMARDGMDTSLDREPLLIDLARVSIPLAVLWSHQVGEKAWDPTPTTPYPLAGLLEGPLSEHEEGMPGVRGGEYGQTMEALQRLVAQGLQVAMPLKSSDLGSLEQLNDKERRALLHAQAQVTRLAFKHHPWAGLGWPVEAINACGGAWVFEPRMLSRRATEHPTFSPQQPIIVYNPGDLSLEQGSFMELWDKLGRGRDADKVIPWFERHGEDAQHLRRRELNRQIRVQATRQQGGTLQSRWVEVLGRLDRDKATSAGYCHLTGLPFGLRALRTNGALLTAALKSPPPCGLDAEGPQGHTIWDAVLFPERPQDTTSVAPWTSIQRLLGKVPLKTGQDKGLMWEPYRPEWMAGLAAKTLSTHPDAWLGRIDLAEKNAARCLATLACGDASSKHVAGASDSAGWLAKLWSSKPELFTPVLQDLLRAMRDIIATQPNRFSFLGQGVTESPMPPPQGSQWHEPARVEMEKQKGSYSQLNPQVKKSEGLLEAMVFEHDLNVRLPGAPAARKPRF